MCLAAAACQADVMRMRQGWDREAGNWAAFARAPGHDRAHENVNLPVLRELLPAPGAATLDFGCGEGRIGRLLASLGHRVAAIDASPAMAGLAHARAGAPPVCAADGTALPFPGGTFDLVVAYMCLHDIDDLPGAAAEISRVLVPGGILCAAIVHPLNSAGAFAGREPGAPFVITGSYAEAAPVTAVADRAGIRLTFHSEHRPLEAYSRALEGAGLLIEAIREARVSDARAAADPAQRRWARIPLFLHLRAVRR
jgi:SAM-dependent methyltransferase